MNIKRNHKCGGRLIACVLLIGLFFQSCVSSLDQVKSEMKEEEVQNIKEEKRAESIEVKKLTLVGEDHSKIDGMKYCYEQISGFVTDHQQEVVNFFVEKDRKRLDNAFKEVKYLPELFNIDYKEAINLFKEYINKLEKTGPKLYEEVYTNIIGKSKQAGLIENRFWFLKIINDFKDKKDKINICSIDGSYEEVIKHQIYQAYAIEKDINKLLEKNQEQKDSIMRGTLASRVRDEIVVGNLTELIKSDTRNIAIVGGSHGDVIKRALEDKGINIELILKL